MLEYINRVKHNFITLFHWLERDEDIFDSIKQTKPTLFISDITNEYNSRALDLDFVYVAPRMFRFIKEKETASSILELFRNGKPSISVTPKTLFLNSQALKIGTPPSIKKSLDDSL